MMFFGLGRTCNITDGLTSFVLITKDARLYLVFPRQSLL